VIAIAVYASVYNAEHQTNWIRVAVPTRRATWCRPSWDPAAWRRLCGRSVDRYELPALFELERDPGHLPAHDSSGRGSDQDGGAPEGFVVALGVCAFLLIFIPTALKLQISVLQYAYFAYTMYGVAVTPALFAR